LTHLPLAGVPWRACYLHTHFARLIPPIGHFTIHFSTVPLIPPRYEFDPFMAIDSVAALLDALRQFPLLEVGRQDETERDLAPRFSDPRALARELINRNWLSPYQVNQLFQGKGADLVLGSYVLMERLGEGGMGQVFKARHQKMDRVVALKVIRK